MTLISTLLLLSVCRKVRNVQLDAITIQFIWVPAFNIRILYYCLNNFMHSLIYSLSIKVFVACLAVVKFPLNCVE